MQAQEKILPAERSSDLESPCCSTLDHQAEAGFQRSGYLALRALKCEARGCVLHLHGCLPSHYLKQVAQSIASGIEGVRRVVNHIEVQSSPGPARVEAGRVTNWPGTRY